MKTLSSRREGETPAEPLQQRLVRPGGSLALWLLMLVAPALASCSRQVAAPPNASDAPLANEPATPTAQASAGEAFGNRPDVLWTLKAEDAFEAAAVHNEGTLYVGDTAGVLYAIDLMTGEPRWKQAFADNSFSTPAEVGAGRLYAVDLDGVVRCLTTDEGEGVWEFATESESYAAPRLHGGALLVTTEAGELISLDAKTGGENWRFAIDGPLRCSPSVAAGHAFLAGCDARLTAVNVDTGEESGAVDIGGQTGSTAALLEGRAYFGTEAGEFLAVDTRDPAKLTIAWRYSDPRRGQGIRTAAAVTDRAVVYGSQGKALYALDPASGEPIWKKPMKTGVESSPIIVSSADGGSLVVAATPRGRLMLLDLASGETVWEYEAGGSFVASPAVVDGRLVIGNTDGTLYCFGERK